MVRFLISIWSRTKRYWYYFRVGNGTYLSFIMGFVQWIILIYELYIAKLPVFSGIHLWEFVLIFTPTYGVAAVIAGKLHMKTQALMDSAVSAPASPYEFKMKPWGITKFLSMPSSLTSFEIQDVWLEYIQAMNPDFKPEWIATKRAELAVYIERTKALLRGEELR